MTDVGIQKMMRNSFGFFYIVFTVLEVYMFAPLMFSYTRELMLCIGFVFAKEVAFVQIAHVSHTEYMPLGNMNYFILTCILLNTSVAAWGFAAVDEYSLLSGLTMLSAFSYFHMVVQVTKEITQELNIKIFKVKVKDFN